MPTAPAGRSSGSSGRRVPRGYGGRSVPTDGNLPRHNARRRRNNRRNDDNDGGGEERRSKYDGPPPHLLHREEGVEDSDGSEDSIGFEGGGSVDDTETHDEQTDESGPKSPSEPSSLPSSAEVSHCFSRARKLRQSVRQSNAAGALSSPPDWRSNCLNAIANCVRECSSIYAHYAPDELDEKKCAKLSLEVFELLQLGLQSGPLAGGKAGYFKRCGSEVAKMALEFLDVAVSGEEGALKLGFSEKQRAAIEKWRIDARKAVEAGKGPSKSAARLQDGSKGGKKKKKGKSSRKG